MRVILCLVALSACAASSSPPVVGAPAPALKGELHDGTSFDLAAKKGQWTVLYFYPKDGTPGCTKQACAFRDSLKKLTELGVTVYGISKDTQESHKKFVAEHRLPFALIADPEGRIIDAWGLSGIFGWSKRWTFVIDPALVVRDVQKDVDPAVNAEQVAASVRALQAGAGASAPTSH